MKRVGVAVLIFMMVLAVVGSGASSASAAQPTCAHWAGHGEWKTAKCETAETNGLWIKVVLGSATKNVGGSTLFCSEVKEGSGIYNDSKCSEEGGKKKFIWTLLTWFIKGTPLATGATEAVANTTAIDTSTVLSAPSLGVRITCSGSIFDEAKPYIQSPNRGGAESLAFTGCSNIMPNTCTVQSTIETEPVVTSVELGTPPATRTVFRPKTGKTFATVDFQGTCSIAGEEPADGAVVVGSQSGAEENVLRPQEGLGTTENNSLELFKGKAYVVGGKGLLKLASGEPWSFALGEA